jgi:hypothetical protein
MSELLYETIKPRSILNFYFWHRIKQQHTQCIRKKYISVKFFMTYSWNNCPNYSSIDKKKSFIVSEGVYIVCMLLFNSVSKVEV